MTEPATADPQGAEALLALVDDLRARVARLEEVVHDGEVHASLVRAKAVNVGLGTVSAGKVTADEAVIGSEVVTNRLRVNAGDDGPQATIQATDDFVTLCLDTEPRESDGCSVAMTASSELEGGYGTVELYRHGNGLARFTVSGEPDINGHHIGLMMSEPDARGDADEVCLVHAGDLARLTRPLPSPTVTERVGALEAWQAGMAEEVVTGRVVAELVEVQAPGDVRPTVTLRAGPDGIDVVNGRKPSGPHVTVGVDDGAGFDVASSRALPPEASVVVWADTDVPGVELDASVDHPRRRGPGVIEVAGGGRGPSVRLADGGAQFQDTLGGGRII